MGQGFYRDDAALYGRRLTRNATKTVRFDLKALVRKAIAFDASDGTRTLEADPNDYTLALFNIGWEDIGHWETKVRLSGLSLQGV